MNQEKAGPGLFLYLRPEEQRAVKVVNLFLVLAELVKFEDRLPSLQTSAEEIHLNFNTFVNDLKLDIQPEEQLRLYTPLGNKCHAVTLHEDGYIQDASWVFEEAILRPECSYPNIQKMASEIGFQTEGLWFEYLMTAARSLLGKASNHPNKGVPPR